MGSAIATPVFVVHEANVLKKHVCRRRSARTIVRAAARTGVAIRTMNWVVRTDHTNRERFLNVTPGARSLKIVTRKFTDPMIEDVPMMIRPTSQKLMPSYWRTWLIRSKNEAGPCWIERGTYPVQPTGALPRRMRVPAGGIIQYPRALIRGYAMSGAPIRSGTK